MSNSVDTGPQPTIANGGFDFSGTITAQSPAAEAAEGSYLTWGHDAASTAVGTTVTGSVARSAGVDVRMARVWRTQVTNASGLDAQLSIRVPVSMLTGVREPQLLISDDPAVPDVSRAIPLTLDGDFYEATFDRFAVGDFFTFGGTNTAATVSKVFAPTSVPVGGTSTMTLTVSNAANAAARDEVSFTDAIPANFSVAATPNVTNTCGGTATTTPTTLTLTGGALPPGPSSCTVTVDVTTAPLVASTIPCPAPASTNGAGNLTLTDDLSFGTGACLAITAVADVSIVKAPPATITPGSAETWTITVLNSGPSVATGVEVIDTLGANVSFVSSDPVDARRPVRW